jgi:MYXO-CTERM domain-containing protein
VCRSKAKAGSSCGESKCADGVTTGKLCDGAGTCADVPPTNCSPYTCDAADRACRTACVSNVDCVSGYRCSATHTCVPKGPEDKRPRGDVCTDGSECQSGFCADDVCCDKACDGQCEACDVKGSQGVCTAIDDKPHGKRPDCASGACGGVCDGIRRDSCTYPNNSTVCGNACTDGTIVTKVCDGKGACVDGALVSCQGFRCDGSDKCQSSCTADIDCLGGYICESNVCLQAATPEPASSGGCGCRTAGTESPSPAWALLLASALIARRRR